MQEAREKVNRDSVCEFMCVCECVCVCLCVFSKWEGTPSRHLTFSSEPVCPIVGEEWASLFWPTLAKCSCWLRKGALPSDSC